MKQSVSDAFVAYSEPKEGLIRHFYADVKGLVTIGIGNLVDPIHYALKLPLKHPDGRPATSAEIAAEWNAVKLDPLSRTKGWTYSVSKTRLRLDDAGVKQVVGVKLHEFDVALHRRYPGYEDFPADAQLALLSLSWACGAAYNFPALDRAVARRDWAACADESQMDETGNPGLRPRNIDHRILFHNAAAGTCPDTLYWPRQLRPDVNTVQGLQAMLMQRGYNVGAIDGDMGPKTKAAIVAFQRDHGLTPDGVAGPKTRNALLHAV